MNNKSFRINNEQFGNATVWPISEHMHSIKWDNWENSYCIFSEHMENNLKDGTWTKLEDSLPRSFKFYCESEPSCIYTYTQQANGNPRVSWEGVGKNYTNSYTLEDVKECIADGRWVVLPEKNKAKRMSPETFADKFEDILYRQTEDAIYTSSPTSGGYSRDPDHSIGEDVDELIAGYTKAVEETKYTADEYCASFEETSVDILAEIKSFTEQSINSTVRIVKDGAYELHSNGYRAAYAYTDEELLELMAAILVVEKALNKKIVKKIEDIF
jgi:hypothetical protein